MQVTGPGGIVCRYILDYTSLSHYQHTKTGWCFKPWFNLIKSMQSTIPRSLVVRLVIKGLNIPPNFPTKWLAKCQSTSKNDHFEHKHHTGAFARVDFFHLKLPWSIFIPSTYRSCFNALQWKFCQRKMMLSYPAESEFIDFVYLEMFTHPRDHWPRYPHQSQIFLAQVFGILKH